MAKKGKHRRYTMARELKQTTAQFDFEDEDAACPECNMKILAGHKSWCEYGDLSSGG